MKVLRLACHAAYDAWTATNLGMAQADSLHFNANWQQEPGKVNSGSRKQMVTKQDSGDLILDSARVRADLNGERSPLEAGPKASY